MYFVCLSCDSSGTGSLMLRTVNTLQQLSSTHSSLELLTPTVLHKLLRGHIALEEPSAIVSSSHLISWDYDTQHVEDDKDNAGLWWCHMILPISCFSLNLSY